MNDYDKKSTKSGYGHHNGEKKSKKHHRKYHDDEQYAESSNKNRRSKHEKNYNESQVSPSDSTLKHKSGSIKSTHSQHSSHNNKSEESYSRSKASRSEFDDTHMYSEESEKTQDFNLDLYTDFDIYNQRKYEKERKYFEENMSEMSRTFRNQEEYWDYKSNQLDSISSFASNNENTFDTNNNVAKKRIFKIVAEETCKLPFRIAVITDHKVLRIFYKENPKSKTYIDINKCKKMIKKRVDDPEVLKQEFESIVINTKFSTDYANKEEFAFRNMYPACVPFNYNRVKLTNLLYKNNDDDYINASYIMDTKGKVFCIASQCPMKEEVERFWSMVYENHCTIIISLLDHDDPKNKVCKYWPSEEKILQADKFTVELLMIKKLATLHIRDIRINPKKFYAPLVVRHINYPTWKVYTIEPKMGDFVNLRNIIIACLDDPIDALPLIHCSSGSGRTALLIAFCMVHNSLLRRESFDIKELVIYLKKQRLFFFDHLNKYTFFYKLMDLCAESLGFYIVKKKR